MIRTSRRDLLWGLGAVGLGNLGCQERVGGETPRRSAVPVTPASGSSAPEPEPVPTPLDPELDASRVADDSFARAVLYTWTSAEQVVELRRTRRLLVHRTSKQGDLSRFDRELFRSTHPLSELLTKEPLQLRRFAWANPWATLRGLNDERYGKQLIRVRLKPGAVVARFDPGAAQPWSAREVDGRTVGIAELVKDPARLAAVYHLSPAAPDERRLAYREYVLCGESQLAQWSYGTPEIREVLNRDAEMLKRLGRQTGHPPAAYRQALAFPTEFYRFSPANLARIRSELGALGFGPELRVSPNVAFADQGKPPTVVAPRPPSRRPWKKPPRKKCMGTWC